MTLLWVLSHHWQIRVSCADKIDPKLTLYIEVWEITHSNLRTRFHFRIVIVHLNHVVLWRAAILGSYRVSCVIGYVEFLQNITSQLMVKAKSRSTLKTGIVQTGLFTLSRKLWREGYQLGVTLSVLKVVDSLPECSGGYISEIELHSAFFLFLLSCWLVGLTLLYWLSKLCFCFVLFVCASVHKWYSIPDGSS